MFLFGLAGVSAAAPLIYPEPQELTVLDGRFRVREDVLVVTPENPSDSDLELARFFVAEMSDRYGLALSTSRSASLPSGKRVVLMGSVANPLVREYCARRGIEVGSESPGPEGYVLDVSEDVVLVAGSDEAGAFYGLQSLRQLVEHGKGESAPAVRVRDWPHKSFRAIKLYLPGRENLAFYRRFLRDFMALYKYNKVMVELNAAMRLDRRPELNAGWREFAKDLNYSRRDRPTGPGEQYQNSAHHDTGDGGVLEKDEVAEIVRWAEELHIEVIPEVPALTHSNYLLTRHRELAEIQEAEWPDTFCPRDPRSYELLFDVLDEYIEVMKPRIMHVGHDEWRMPWNVCEKCKGSEPGELFAEDIEKVHRFLSNRGIGMAIWGDHLLENVREKGLRKTVSPSGYRYEMPGALSPELVENRIPKDILIFNWFWRDEDNDISLSNWGFEQVYGNFRTEIGDYGRRSRRKGVIGGAPSSWSATTEFNFGKDLLHDFVSCAAFLWSTKWPGEGQWSRIVQEMMPGIHRNLTGVNTPSADGEEVVAVALNSPPAETGFDAGELKTGTIRVDRTSFNLEGRPVVARSDSHATIQVGADASSLIFLHAAAAAAGNEPGHRYIYNFPDTADLLGWYEVVYEDGFLVTVPIRYGENILEWEWGRNPRPGSYCYRGQAVQCAKDDSAPVTFFAFEWTNPRFGKVINEVRLKPSRGFRNTRGEIIDDNAVILLAMSMTKKRSSPDSNRVAAGRFFIDPPTLENLGFRWYIEGDANRNASVAVSYRVKGEASWKEALPMLRVHHEVVNQAYGPHRTGNLFAGSVMFLEPGTEYQIRFVMDDPDGGAPPAKVVAVATAAEPRLPTGGRTLPVSPDSARGLAEAYAAAEPGDTVLLSPGVYRYAQTLKLTNSGTAAKPIVIRGSEGGTVIEGAGHETDLFDISGANHLIFENLTLRHARKAIEAGKKGGPGASGLVVRRCRIEDVIYGINTTSEQSSGWYIADNVMTGINPTWFPRPQQGYMSPSHTGVNVYGRGHVVCHNRISKFSDSIAIANFGVPLRDPEMHPVAIDFYNNDLSFAQDDAIETDYGAHNVRVYRNRCYNVHTGLSAQPFYGGPVYFIRNELYSITSLTFKLHNYCAGIVAYHNTVASAGPGFLSFNRWQNGHFRNNLFLGGENFNRPDGRVRVAYAMDTGTITDYSTLDYNGYRRNVPDGFIRWFDGETPASYPNLPDFTAATGHERHGLMVDYDVFRGATVPSVWTTYNPDQYDLRLKRDSSPIDAGAVLPNVNDGYTGKAPDLGCHELDHPAPHYGPR